MHFNPTVEALWREACPSIRYRMGQEILGRGLSEEEMSGLQTLILQDSLVRALIEKQEVECWRESSFHGSGGIEAGVKMLRQKGVLGEHPVIKEALAFLAESGAVLKRGIGRPGEILDACGFGGSEMIRAVVFAYAGGEGRDFVQAQVEEALKTFAYVLKVNGIEEISKLYKGKLVFEHGVCWPGYYQLRLLALTRGWRTPDNLQMLAESIQKLVSFSPIPEILVLEKSQLVAPAGFMLNDFNSDLEKLKDSTWMLWLDQMEMLARLGVVRLVPELDRQAVELAEILETGDGWFTRKLNHPYFRQWGAYTGMQLEPDWRSPLRRMNDLTFRSLLILHHALN